MSLEGKDLKNLGTPEETSGIRAVIAAIGMAFVIAGAMFNSLTSPSSPSPEARAAEALVLNAQKERNIATIVAQAKAASSANTRPKTSFSNTPEAQERKAEALLEHAVKYAPSYDPDATPTKKIRTSHPQTPAFNR